jgi:hypothetical protein
MASRALGIATALVAACSASDAGYGDYPPTTPGPGGTGTGSAARDAGAIDAPGDGGSAITARVCLVSDLRRVASLVPADCAATGAGGIAVTLGGQRATTAADGGFSIPREAGSNVAWSLARAPGPGVLALQRALIPYDASRSLLPAVTEARYRELATANGGLYDPGTQGAIVAGIVRGAAALAGATAGVAGEPEPTRYDAATPDAWAVAGGTGVRGIAWIPELAPGVRQVSITPAGGATSSAAVAVALDTVTFVVLAAP